MIGGGPGGYVAAIRAAQLGQKTAVVERDKAGGRCLNYACIPAKTVLHTAEIFSTVTEEGADLGIKASGTSIDWKALQERRAKVSKTLEDGVQFLWNKNKAEFLHGEASLAGAGKVKVGDEEHQAKAIVLATGSVALPIPGVDFSDRVIDTWGAYSLESMPKSLVVAGAGASGSEIASAYSRLGIEVTLIEMLDQILPLEDKDMARVVERQFKKDGMEVLTGTKVEERERAEERRHGQGRRQGGQGRLPGDRGRSAAGHRPAQPRCGRREDQRPRSDRDRRVPADLGRRHLRHRRSRPRPGPRPQGRGGGRGRRRDRRGCTRPRRSTSTSFRARPSATRRWRASG